MWLLNGCAFLGWIAQVNQAQQGTNQNKNVAVEYLQKKYNREVEKITYDSSSDTFGVRTGSFFHVKFEGEDFEFTISTKPKMEDTYLRNKWDQQMSLNFNSRIAEQVLKAFKGTYPKNSVLEDNIDIEWNHDKEVFDSNFEIPNTLLEMSIQDLYAQGYINKTNIRQHHWIKKDDLVNEKQKTLLYMSALARHLNSPDMSISVNYHTIKDKMNIDIKKLQELQIFQAIDNWDEYSNYYLEFKDVDAVAKGNLVDVWRNSKFNVSGESDFEISNILKKLSKSRKLNDAIKNNRNFLEGLKFNKSDIEKALQEQLSGKYQAGQSYDVVNIVLADELFGESKIAFARIKANDKYSTEFLALVDCNDYRYSPEICAENYFKRFIEKYMEEDFFNMDKFDVSDYCVEGDFYMVEEEYDNALKSGDLENIIIESGQCNIRILLSRSNHTIDKDLLQKFEDDISNLREQSRNVGGGILQITVTFMYEGSYEMHGNKEYIKSNMLYFVDKRKLLQYGNQYDWSYPKQLTVFDGTSVIDGYHTFIKKHPLAFW